MSVAQSAGDLAVRFGCELAGDPAVEVDHVATLSQAGSSAVTFLANPHYRPQLEETHAGVVILAASDVDACPVTALISDDPYLLFARIANELHPLPALRAGVSELAHLCEGCEVPESCEVAAGATVGSGAALGQRVYIGANAVVGERVTIGADTKIMAGAILSDRVTVGARCIIHSGVVIGADGFGFAREKDGTWTKVPQIGSVVVGDDVEIGANTTVDRGAIGDTVIEDGVRLDNQIQVGHNVRIGAHTAIAGQVGVAGSARVGARCLIGGQAGIGGHLEVADDTVVQGRTMVTHSIRKAGVYAGGGVPMEEAGSWRRNAARFRKLDDMARRLLKLEKMLPGARTTKPDEDAGK